MSNNSKKKKNSKELLEKNNKINEKKDDVKKVEEQKVKTNDNKERNNKNKKNYYQGNEIKEKKKKIETKNNDQQVKKEESIKENAIVKINDNKTLSIYEQVEQGKKRKIFFLFFLETLIIFIFIISVIFALINVTKSNIINGVFVKNINVSNLSISDAKSMLKNAFNIELNATIELNSKDYQTTINGNQIEFEYDVEKMVEDAYYQGRKGNIFQNNYEILKSTLFGKNIEVKYSYNKEILDYIVDDIESKLPGLVTEASFYIEDDELIIIPGTDGIIVNKEKLKNEIINTVLSANYLNLLNNNENFEIEIPIENVKAKEIDIDSIYSKVYTEPKDAYFEADPFKIYAEVNGIDFGIGLDEIKEMIKIPKNEYKIPLVITPATKTINDIGLEAFPYQISEFTTKYDASNINRSQNLAIAASKIDGTVLMPNEEFSFNQVVGKRTIQEGYKDAKIYENGKVVDGLAGGICQISSTLYNAVIEANLEVLERKNHSFTTSYIKAGKDATVVYGVIDFKFKNTRTYPIKISASVNSGIVEFRINGIKEEIEYEVSLYPVTTASIPFSTQYIPDPSLAPGQQVVVQKGGNGLKVTTYKDTKLEGKLISREIVSNDTYSPMSAIIRVGQ